MLATGETPAPLEYPELIIGIAGPIGVNMDLIVQCFGTALTSVGYTHELIKLTDEMAKFPITDSELQADVAKWTGLDTHTKYMRKMSEANALRKQYRDPAVLARIAINTVRQRRAASTRHQDSVRPNHGYLVRQLKRPEEVALLRKVYGRQFILVSAYAPESERKQQLVDRLKQELSTATREVELAYKADQLIDRDANEDNEKLGQQLRETFHLADIFIDGLNKNEMELKLQRFVESLFGKNDITPSKDEYGMYAARSASLRSADLSRQVGAAVFSNDGELITQGCNEVPKAHGGTYWDLEKPDHRDIKKGHDPNERHKKETLRDLIERFRSRGYLSEAITKFGSDADIVEELTAKRKPPHSDGGLVGSRIMDLTEYGRVVHAEMLAVCDAARIGRSIKGATLYCTTFPCHNCTKHIIASGIRRVVYMEPYPKSRAKDLHPDEIEIEAENPSKVSYVPFMGISPFRYRDIFQKGKRKADNGTAYDWYNNEKRPMIDVVFPSYPQNEEWALGPLLGDIESAKEASIS